MLVIRYFRTGKRNQPNFKIVVTDKRRPAKGGRFLEQVGTYDPVKKRKALKVDRIKYWLSVGAQPSDTVHNLLVSEKIIEEKKIDVHKEKKAVEGKEGKPAAETPAPAEKKPVEETKSQAEEKAAEEKPKEEEPKPAEEAKPKVGEKPAEPPKEEPKKE